MIIWMLPFPEGEPVHKYVDLCQGLRFNSMDFMEGQIEEISWVKWKQLGMGT